MDIQTPKRELLNGFGALLNGITRNLDAEDGEFYTNNINRLIQSQHENFSKKIS